ncbi:uroporphyrinogen decarboxylase family protein [Acetobacterium wieringae]|uniref:Uroporphyrinogen decarboxylase (URO-D) n=1 Tax=Acetobacterium wieringae TaxID=52694 RepID=A0A1F2PCI1_9FIRM|nr:uroporphyrinogen decarboxylase family protein [Acetobacterium wieringae]OFV68958.1 uroporphyrinogen decarboxylase (URO-D) [Acetobacterium wieringae]
MTTENLYNNRLEDIQKTLKREKPQYVPIFGNPGQGVVAYSGTTIREAYYDPEKFVDAMTRIYERLWIDCTNSNGITWMPNFQKYQKSPQITLAPDGISNVAVTRTQMNEDEYDVLIKDPDAFVRDVLLPRTYPELFENGIDHGVEAFKAGFNDMGNLFYLNELVMKAMAEKYGIVQLTTEDLMIANPLDTIFDYLRGFVGTSIDIRRRKSQVKEAADVLWERCTNQFKELPYTFPFCVQPAHLPTYLNPKQFAELYWPYEKAIIENIASQGGKAGIFLEGSWLHVLDFFRDVPKDSCILFADSDDVIEVSKRIGDYQIVGGGAINSKMKCESKEVNLDYTKRVIDECARDGGFFFTTDKNWNCPSDIMDNMFDVFDCAHEYGRY